jgi:orotate phosphoribosyltransferase
MFIICRRVALCLIVLLLVIMFGSFVQSSGQPSPNYFPLSVNAVWKYKFTTSTGGEFEFTQKMIEAEKQDDGSTW